MHAVIQPSALSDRDFVSGHVRRITAAMGVDEVYQDLAVFEAQDALGRGAARDVAIHVGVESAARVRVAGRQHVARREKPALRIVRPEPDQPRRRFDWDALVCGAIAIALLTAALLKSVSP